MSDVAEDEVWHPSTLAEKPISPSEQLRALVDEVLDNEPYLGAAAAAEAAADALGFHYKRTTRNRRGYQAVEVALDGQRPRGGWRRALSLGMRGMWASGAWITVSDAYRSGDEQDWPWTTGWPLSHEIVYR